MKAGLGGIRIKEARDMKKKKLMLTVGVKNVGTELGLECDSGFHVWNNKLDNVVAMLLYSKQVCVLPGG